MSLLVLYEQEGLKLLEVLIEDEGPQGLTDVEGALDDAV